MLTINDKVLPPETVIQDICHADLKYDRPNGKGEFIFRCPIRTDKWVEINVRKGGIWKCFRECTNCPGNRGGGLLEFCRLYFACDSNREAINLISKYIGTHKEQCDMRKSNMISPIKQTDMASPETLDKTYRAFLQQLPLGKEHYEDLKKRGMTDEDIRAMDIKSLPQNGLSMIARNLVAEGYMIKGVPGFYTDKNGTPMVNCYGSGYFIPYRDTEDHIIGMQIRYDIDLSKAKTEAEVKELKAKRYRAFTSSGKDGGTAAITAPFLGIPHKRHRQDVVYVTEGGLKAATAQSLSNGWFTAIPGVSTYEAFRTLMRHLQSVGVKTVVDAFDSDRASNQSVANAIDKLHKIAAEEFGITMQTWDWGAEQKGVDDYLLAQEIKRREQGLKGRKIKKVVVAKAEEIPCEQHNNQIEMTAAVQETMDFMDYLEPPKAF